MIWGCAGNLRAEFFLSEMIIPRESNSHAQHQIGIPHMASKLQTSHKTISRRAAKPQKEQRRKQRTLPRLHDVGLTLEQKGTKGAKNPKTENPVMLQLNDVMGYMPILAASVRDQVMSGTTKGARY
jgi:hypothetical protein